MKYDYIQISDHERFRLHYRVSGYLRLSPDRIHPLIKYWNNMLYIMLCTEVLGL